VAIEYSKQALDIYKFPRMPHLQVLIRIAGVRDKFRRTLARMFSKKPAPVQVSGDIISPLDPYKDTFAEQNWAFVENFLEEEIQDNLLKTWPKFYYFRPVAFMTKSYDLGFVLKNQDKERPQYLDHHPYLEKIYNYLDGEEFAQKVTVFCNDGIARARHSILLTRAYTGSSVIPHRDTIATTKEGEHFLNFVIFVHGSGGPRSGGLCIMNGPEFDDIVFEPHDLVNTALVYRSNAIIWHGFAPMRFGAFRWTINCQFCSKEWLERECPR